MVAVKFDTILGSVYVNGGVVVSESKKKRRVSLDPAIGWKMSIPPLSSPGTLGTSQLHILLVGLKTFETSMLHTGNKSARVIDAFRGFLPALQNSQSALILNPVSRALGSGETSEPT